MTKASVSLSVSEDLLGVGATMPQPGAGASAWLRMTSGTVLTGRPESATCFMNRLKLAAFTDSGAPSGS